MKKFHQFFTTKIEFESTILSFLTNCRSSLEYLFHFFEYVDSRQKILLFWTHHSWNSTTELILRVFTRLFEFAFLSYAMRKYELRISVKKKILEIFKPESINGHNCQRTVRNDKSNPIFWNHILWHNNAHNRMNLVLILSKSKTLLIKYGAVILVSIKLKLQLFKVCQKLDYGRPVKPFFQGNPEFLGSGRQIWAMYFWPNYQHPLFW